MADSTFDAEAFLTTVYKDRTDDKLIPADEGEYLCQITKVTAKRITAAKSAEVFTVMEVTWQILDEEVKRKTGLEKPFARQSIFLELNDSGNVDMSKGKNVALGKLREALRQNSSGKPWSPQAMVTMTAWCKVKQEADDNNPEVIRNRVVAVAEKKSEPKGEKKAA